MSVICAKLKTYKTLLKMYVVWFHHPGSVLCKQQDNWSALLNAAKEGHHDIVTLLLEHGAEVDHKDIVRCHTQYLLSCNV